MNISQADIARATGITARHINRIFRRHCTPSVKLAQRIEKLAGIPWTSWFVDDTPSGEKAEQAAKEKANA